MKLYHTKTGFYLGDPQTDSLLSLEVPDQDIRHALNSMILSASGWRKIFAGDGNEESASRQISRADQCLAAAMGLAFSRFLKEKSDKRSPVLALGLDSRPTGPGIAGILIRVFLSQRIKARYLFIASAPEIMAYTKTDPALDGFAYVSASHNPLGHNGVKFGLADGAVLGGDDAAALIRAFKELVRSFDLCPQLKELTATVQAQELEAVFGLIDRYKKEALEAYSAFSKQVISDSRDRTGQEHFFTQLKESLAAQPLGVVAELNGSARTLTIDREFFREQGVRIKVINGRPGQITHPIVPEGSSLDLCRRKLEEQYQADPCFLLGYVPDNDGDRGNVVYINRRTGKAAILKAQEVFALACVAELAFLVYTGALEYDAAGRPRKNLAVVVNGPTSLRVERVCAAFGAQVFRAEVGEANLVNLAARKREQGFMVRILGEGSNGGNITHPSTVRDPLNTLFALIKLLSLKDPDHKPALFRIWLQKSGLDPDTSPSAIDISDVLATLPVFRTTDAFEPRAKAAVAGNNHKALKAFYEKLFLKQWQRDKRLFRERWGISGWEIINYEGTEATAGMGSQYRGGEEKGGFKVLFKDSAGNATAFIWMRGSGTEAVFRILADSSGEDRAREEWLLAWHLDIIHRADQLAGAESAGG